MGDYDWTTEGGRFWQQPMCTDLTGECARGYLADIEKPEARIARGEQPGKGPDNVENDLVSGRVIGGEELAIRRATGKET